MIFTQTKCLMIYVIGYFIFRLLSGIYVQVCCEADRKQLFLECANSLYQSMFPFWPKTIKKRYVDNILIIHFYEFIFTLMKFCLCV